MVSGPSDVPRTVPIITIYTAKYIKYPSFITDNVCIHVSFFQKHHIKPADQNKRSTEKQAI